MIFSKLLSGMWPNFDSAGKKCQKLFEDYRQGKDIKCFQTNGTEDKRMPEPKRTKTKTSPTNKGNEFTATNGSSDQKDQPNSKFTNQQ